MFTTTKSISSSTICKNNKSSSSSLPETPRVRPERHGSVTDRGEGEEWRRVKTTYRRRGGGLLVADQANRRRSCDRRPPSDHRSPSLSRHSLSLSKSGAVLWF
ncbi:hypothetical protein Hanom_Chr02g00130721 [Helianthus anomalus]